MGKAREMLAGYGIAGYRRSDAQEGSEERYGGRAEHFVLPSWNPYEQIVGIVEIPHHRM
jgi:hypothetical protein